MLQCRSLKLNLPVSPVFLCTSGEGHAPRIGVGVTEELMSGAGEEGGDRQLLLTPSNPVKASCYS
jgi:hypothetical protein